MKGKQIHPPYKPCPQFNSSQVIFRHCSSSSAGNVIMRVDLDVDDKNACKVAWAVHVSKIYVTGLGITRLSWDLRDPE